MKKNGTFRYTTFYGLHRRTSMIELNKLIAIGKEAFYPLQGRITDTIVFELGG